MPCYSIIHDIPYNKHSCYYHRSCRAPLPIFIHTFLAKFSVIPSHGVLALFGTPYNVILQTALGVLTSIPRVKCRKESLGSSKYEQQLPPGAPWSRNLNSLGNLFRQAQQHSCGALVGESAGVEEPKGTPIHLKELPWTVIFARGMKRRKRGCACAQKIPCERSNGRLDLQTRGKTQSSSSTRHYHRSICLI